MSLDAAHPAWWRGEEYGTWQAARLIANVIFGKDTGKGAMNAPAGLMRDAVLKLKQERDNLNRWNNRQAETIKKYQKRNNNQAITINNYQTENKTQELRAAKSSWTKAQMRCKHHALRGDALEKERDKLQNKIAIMQHYWKDLLDIVKERNELRETCAETIKEIIVAEYKIKNLNEETKLLEAENVSCWERIHNLEEENGVHYDRIGELKVEIFTLQSKKLVTKEKNKIHLDGDGLNEFLDTMAKLYNWIRCMLGFHNYEYAKRTHYKYRGPVTEFFRRCKRKGCKENKSKNGDSMVT